MIHCFQSVDELAGELSRNFRDYILAQPVGNSVHIAFSGGNTPKSFFNRLTSDLINGRQHFSWERIHFYWVDERCVPPDHPDSNYFMTQTSLLSKIRIDENNIHRIRGESNPEQEARRYAREIENNVEKKDGKPVFDWIFLGIGDDGHTASIFPDSMELLHSSGICEAVRHPVSGQFRITLTGQVILQAKKITFLVTGSSKSRIVSQILNKNEETSRFPAGYIHVTANNADWYIDREAGQHINTSHCGKH
jgi:6-phosphogluconolactonase